MRYLVTGGTGFIGRILVRELLAAGHTVSVLSRDVTRVPGTAQALEANLEGNSEWAAAVAGIDAVIHLGARVHVMREVETDPLNRFRTVNTAPSLALASVAARLGVRRFLFLSTLKVHGEITDGRPFRADDPPAPTDAYSQSKWEAEEGLRAIERTSDLEVCVIRPPLVYGPGVRGNVLRLIGLIARGVPLPLAWVDNRRTMVGVSNLVGLIGSVLAHPGSVSGAFLVGDREDLSTPAFVRLISEALKRSPRLLPCPVPLLRALGGAFGFGPELDRLVTSLQADSAATRERFHWAPPIPIAEEVMAMTQAWSSRR